MSGIEFHEQEFNESYFLEAASFLKKFWWLLDFKWTDVLIKETFDKIPDSWVDFLVKLDAVQVEELLMTYKVASLDVPDSLAEFVELCEKLSIRLKWTTVTGDINRSDMPKKNKKISDKKSKEVESVVNIITRLVSENLGLKQRNEVTVLDVGAGLGYISEKLHDTGFKVIGIEAQGQLCDTANARYEGKSIQFIPMKVDQSEECVSNIRSVLSTEMSVIAIGLHCCGDLLNNVLNIFNRIENIRAVVCVTCCYHLIDSTSSDFPRSKTFATTTRSLDINFNSTVLRVGTYDPPPRWCGDISESKLDLHTKTCFYRAVLEKVLCQPNVEWQRRHKKKMHCKLDGTFDEFLASVESGFSGNSRESSLKQLTDIFIANDSSKPKVNALKNLQTLIQPVMESVVVLDHVVKLRELGYRTTVVQCFDLQTSPRNICLIAIK